MTFAALGLSKKCLIALEREGFEAPTPIQAQAISDLLRGSRLLGLGLLARWRLLA